jgi:hypothetical protein
MTAGTLFLERCLATNDVDFLPWRCRTGEAQDQGNQG